MKHLFPLFCVLVAHGSVAAADTFHPPGPITIINPNPNLPQACEVEMDAPLPSPAPAGHACERINVSLDLTQDPVNVDPLYIAAFPDNCFYTETKNFVCYFKAGKYADKACQAKVKSHDQIAHQVNGEPAWTPTVYCKWNDTGDYYKLYDGDDIERTELPLVPQPRQIDKFTVDGVPDVAVSGPYSTLSDGNAIIAPGRAYGCSRTDTVKAVNMANHDDGRYHSDLAGYGPYPCPTGMCIEPDDITNLSPQVHHVVPKADKRGCGWGKKTYANAALISAQLNRYFSNNNPPEDEIYMINHHAKYTP